MHAGLRQFEDSVSKLLIDPEVNKNIWDKKLTVYNKIKVNTPLNYLLCILTLSDVYSSLHKVNKGYRSQLETFVQQTKLTDNMCKALGYQHYNYFKQPYISRDNLTEFLNRNRARHKNIITDYNKVIRLNSKINKFYICPFCGDPIIGKGQCDHVIPFKSLVYNPHAANWHLNFNYLHTYCNLVKSNHYPRQVNDDTIDITPIIVDHNESNLMKKKKIHSDFLSKPSIIMLNNNWSGFKSKPGNNLNVVRTSRGNQDGLWINNGSDLTNVKTRQLNTIIIDNENLSSVPRNTWMINKLKVLENILLYDIVCSGGRYRTWDTCKDKFLSYLDENDEVNFQLRKQKIRSIFSERYQTLYTLYDGLQKQIKGVYDSFHIPDDTYENIVENLRKI